MTRPAWLGPEPTGAAADLCVLRGLLVATTAYARLGVAPPIPLVEALRGRVDSLVSHLRRELVA